MRISDWSSDVCSSDLLVVTWPGHINQPEDIRDQFHHVNDIMPTLLEAAGVPAPKIVDGSTQHSLDGVSMTYTFKGPTLPGRHDVQYFELLGNRAIYRDGRSEEHTSELQSLMRISYAVFCLKKTKHTTNIT